MKLSIKAIVGLCFYFATVSGCVARSLQETQALLEAIRLPDGFKISIFADNVPNARTLALGDNGLIFIGTRQEGAVYAVRDADQDGVAERRYVIASGLSMPNGVAYQGGDLYVAEVNRIIKFTDIEKHLGQTPQAEIIFDQLPDKTHHGWKYLRLGPDGKLYFAVGAPCNICEPDQAVFATLVRMNPDGSQFEIIGRGIRNTVGYDWHPETNQLYFTENGRDHLGDNRPPDELNRWSKVGQHFGYPYCHGGTLRDPEFGKGKSCGDYTPPVWRFKAHLAPLGLRFYQGDQFPEQFRNQLFVAQHGSWNRSTPHGYRIVLVKFKKGQPYTEKVFAKGWLTSEGKVLGRPVDILELPDGSLLVTDDNAGLVYRITYSG